MVARGRLIHDRAGDGAWNMAVDEALLESVARGGGPVLRFYSWSQPTLSLGYFQKYEDRSQHPSSLDCSVVRRASGGGAILHHHEVTYSLAWPSKDRFTASSAALYSSLHRSLLKALDQLHITGNLSSSESSTAFLCFSRRAVGDVLLSDVKIGGSAQRRYQGAILQHGSVLLKASPFAPELLGIEELTDVRVKSDTLKKLWVERISDELDLELGRSEITLAERELAFAIKEQKFGSSSWLWKR